MGFLIVRDSCNTIVFYISLHFISCEQFLFDLLYETILLIKNCLIVIIKVISDVIGVLHFVSTVPYDDQ